MNGKQAKRLRKQAEELTVGLPERDEFRAENTKKYTDESGKVVKMTGTLVLENCTRATYQKLKREYKNDKKQQI